MRLDIYLSGLIICPNGIEGLIIYRPLGLKDGAAGGWTVYPGCGGRAPGLLSASNVRTHKFASFPRRLSTARAAQHAKQALPIGMRERRCRIYVCNQLRNVTPQRKITAKC